MEEQLTLPGIEEDKVYPFQTMKLEQRKCKIFGLVTNMDWEGGKLIRWHYKRCGKSEEAHSVMPVILVKTAAAIRAHGGMRSYSRPLKSIIRGVKNFRRWIWVTLPTIDNWCK
jgi:hypothetical protein